MSAKPESKTLDEIAKAMRREVNAPYLPMGPIFAALQQAYDLGRAERDKEWSAVIEAWRGPESLPDCLACAALDARESDPAEPKEGA